jgi:transglutaminase-like putative cysteine protease
MTTTARYRVIHETRYQYTAPVSSARQIAHLTPRSTDWQTVHEHRLAISPAPTEQSEGEDFFGNHVTRFTHDSGFDEQIVHAESLVEVQPHTPAADAPSPDWRSVQQMCTDGAPALRFELAQFCTASILAPVLPEAAEYAKVSLREGGPWLTCLLDLTNRIHTDFVFDPAATTVTTPVLEIIEKKRGVCQDFAHLMISCLRSVGLPARYVSGYILTQPPAGQPRLIGADASHAWVSAYCPEFGWVDFDPTNGKLANTEFITLGWGRDFSDITPLRGVVLGSGAQEMEVRVTVMPLDATLSSAGQSQTQNMGAADASPSSLSQSQSQSFRS